MRKFCLFLFCFCFLFDLPAQRTVKSVDDFIVVIDPGHGGVKPGAKGKKSWEKDVTLQVAKKVGELLKKYSNVKVIYTRTDDSDVDLIKRSQIANKNKANIFVSIHCNSAPSASANGVETFVMGLAKTQGNIEAAKKENQDILLEADYLEKYDGFNPNSPEANIFFSLFQNAYLEQSLKLASLIQEQYKNNIFLTDRGVKQAPYLVLWKTSVPAVLTEIGFISNKNEEELITSQEGQQKIAYSIYAAIINYRNSIDKNEDKPLEYEDIFKPKKKEIIKDSISNNIVFNDTTLNNNQIDTTITFKIQFLTSQTLISKNENRFIKLQDFDYYIENALYKYTAGKFSTFDEANKYRKEMVEKGYKDCFVVAFKGRQRIDVNSARKGN